MVLFPIGAWALSFTNVAIIDPGGVNRAKVNAAGQLSTSAAVTGSVTATATAPSASYTNTTLVAESACSSVTPTVPAGKALVVTSITVSIAAVTTGPVFVDALSATPGPPCGAVDAVDQVYISAKGESGVMSIPSGFPVKPGHVVGLSMFSTSGDAAAVVAVHGYLVSSTLCTVTGPPTGCN